MAPCKAACWDFADKHGFEIQRGGFHHLVEWQTVEWGLLLWLQFVNSGAELTGQFWGSSWSPSPATKERRKSSQQVTSLWEEWKLASLSTPSSGGTILKTPLIQNTVRGDLRERGKRRRKSKKGEGERGREREKHECLGLLIACRLAVYLFQAVLVVPARG